MERVEVAPQETMLSLIGGFWIARSIYLAAQLGVADLFDDQPKTIAQLATEKLPSSDARSWQAAVGRKHYSTRK